MQALTSSSAIHDPFPVAIFNMDNKYTSTAKETLITGIFSAMLKRLPRFAFAMQTISHPTYQPPPPKKNEKKKLIIKLNHTSLIVSELSTQNDLNVKEVEKKRFSELWL